MHIWALGLSCETPAAPPDRAAGARTRQPENSKRVHFRAPALRTPPKFHERTPRERKKKENYGGGGKKKREILDPPPFGAPPFGAPPFEGPTLCRPKIQHPKIGRSRSRSHSLGLTQRRTEWSGRHRVLLRRRQSKRD